jgi:hypothetical protein
MSINATGSAAGPASPVRNSLDQLMEDPVSFEPLQTAMLLDCGHSINKDSLDNLSEPKRCPCCRAAITNPKPDFALRSIADEFAQQRPEREAQLLTQTLANKSKHSVLLEIKCRTQNLSKISNLFSDRIEAQSRQIEELQRTIKSKDEQIKKLQEQIAQWQGQNPTVIIPRSSPSFEASREAGPASPSFDLVKAGAVDGYLREYYFEAQSEDSLIKSFAIKEKESKKHPGFPDVYFTFYPNAGKEREMIEGLGFTIGPEIEDQELTISPEITVQIKKEQGLTMQITDLDCALDIFNSIAKDYHFSPEILDLIRNGVLQKRP